MISIIGCRAFLLDDVLHKPSRIVKASTLFLHGVVHSPSQRVGEGKLAVRLVLMSMLEIHANTNGKEEGLVLTRLRTALAKKPEEFLMQIFTNAVVLHLIGWVRSRRAGSALALI